MMILAAAAVGLFGENPIHSVLVTLMGQIDPTVTPAILESLSFLGGIPSRHLYIRAAQCRKNRPGTFRAEIGFGP